MHPCSSRYVMPSQSTPIFIVCTYFVDGPPLYLETAFWLLKTTQLISILGRVKVRLKQKCGNLIEKSTWIRPRPQFLRGITRPPQASNASQGPRWEYVSEGAKYQHCSVWVTLYWFMFQKVLKSIRVFLKSVGAKSHVLKKCGCQGTHSTHAKEVPAS